MKLSRTALFGFLALINIEARAWGTPTLQERLKKLGTEIVQDEDRSQTRSKKMQEFAKKKLSGNSYILINQYIASLNQLNDASLTRFDGNNEAALKQRMENSRKRIELMLAIRRESERLKDGGNRDIGNRMDSLRDYLNESFQNEIAAAEDQRNFLEFNAQQSKCGNSKGKEYKEAANDLVEAQEFLHRWMSRFWNQRRDFYTLAPGIQASLSEVDQSKRLASQRALLKTLESDNRFNMRPWERSDMKRLIEAEEKIVKLCAPIRYFTDSNGGDGHDHGHDPKPSTEVAPPKPTEPPKAPEAPKGPQGPNDNRPADTKALPESLKPVVERTAAQINDIAQKDLARLDSFLKDYSKVWGRVAEGKNGAALDGSAPPVTITEKPVEKIEAHVETRNDAIESVLIEERKAPEVVSGTDPANDHSKQVTDLALTQVRDAIRAGHKAITALNGQIRDATGAKQKAALMAQRDQARALLQENQFIEQATEVIDQNLANAAQKSLDDLNANDTIGGHMANQGNVAIANQIWSKSDYNKTYEQHQLSLGSVRMLRQTQEFYKEREINQGNLRMRSIESLIRSKSPAAADAVSKERARLIALIAVANTAFRENDQLMTRARASGPYFKDGRNFNSYGSEMIQHIGGAKKYYGEMEAYFASQLEALNKLK